MALYTGTITNANPAAAYVGQLETSIAAYNAIGTPDNNTYTKIETVTSVTGWQYEVYKNNGTGVQLPNLFGADFYLHFGFQTAAGSSAVRIIISEDYNSTNDLIIRPTAGTGTTVTVDTDYSFGGSAGVTHHAAGVVYNIIPSLPTTGFEYYHVINRDGMFLGAKVSLTDTLHYAGLFEPAFSYATFTPAKPLVLVKAQQSSSYNNGMTAAAAHTTRHPNIATGSNANSPFSHAVADWGNGAGDYQTADRFSGKAEGVKQLIRANANSAANSGINHGWLKNVFKLDGPSSARLGDTLTFDGRVHLAAMQFANQGAGANAMWVDTEAA